MHSRLGFMQGRLSPRVDGKIQAFPTEFWRNEFVIGRRNGCSLMEWTLDHQGFSDNPLMTDAGRAEIRELMSLHGFRIESVTADNMMQAPFWKASGDQRVVLLEMLRSLIYACGQLGGGIIVVPLVDNGAIQNTEQESSLFNGLQSMLHYLSEAKVRIAFESDFAPALLSRFISTYQAQYFGINFDMGNSASLGWRSEIEIPHIGSRIINVHVKDRPIGGSTVPLGEGDVDFETVFGLLRKVGYNGNYILQGARAADDDHAGAILRYCRFVGDFLNDR